jgi:hypothetical protein
MTLFLLAMAQMVEVAHYATVTTMWKLDEAAGSQPVNADAGCAAAERGLADAVLPEPSQLTRVLIIDPA